MNVLVLPADEEGSGSYRMIGPAQALIAQGHDVEIVLNRGIGARDNPDGSLHVEVGDADVVVVQRPYSPAWEEIVPALHRQGVAVVVDIDDDFARIHPRNPVHRYWDPSLYPDHNWRHMRRACQLADMVTVSSPVLEERYGFGHGRLLRNCIPARALATVPRTNCSSPTFGWPARLGNHPDDPPIASGAVARLVREGHSFRIVGNPGGCGRAFGLGADPPGEPVPFDDWFDAVATLDVAIAPLSDSAFSGAKSWLKPLECGAVGVPCVASPSPEYVRFAAEGGAVIARKRKDWYPILKRLLTDHPYRADLSAQVRDVAGRHVLEDHAWRWLEAWTEALDRVRQGALR